MLRRYLIVAFAGLLVGSGALRADTTLDFEGFPDSTILTNQYPFVTFNNTIILTAGISLNEFEFPPHSGVNVASDNGGPIQVGFAVPQFSVGAFFTYAQPIIIQAFDAHNVLLGTATSNAGCVSNEAISGTPGCPPNEFIQLKNIGSISTIVITGDPAGGSFAMDDLTFSDRPDDTYQVGYAANLTAGDSVIDLTSAGSVSGLEPQGDICANVYVFAEDQQLIACCACPLTPNHLKTLSVNSDLIVNTLTPGKPSSITVALLATKASTGAAVCDAAALPGGTTIGNTYFPSFVSGLAAWETTLHAKPAGGFGVNELPLSKARLSNSELAKLTSACGFIASNGSGYGICNSCRTGAQGAGKR